jgi:3D (Asp-Asp-Asp) domain-containing protein
LNVVATVRFRFAVVLCITLVPWSAGAARQRAKAAAGATTFIANAYCQSGRTQSGLRTKPGMIAADPHVLPLGSQVRIEGGKGVQSGVYTVTDTGGIVKGRRLDIYMPNCRAAKAFGARRVRVATLRRGWGAEGSPVAEQRRRNQ